MAKRDNGAGTVTQRSRTNPDGSIYKYWEGRITTGTGSDGKQKRRTVTAKTKAELLSKMREITRALEDGTYTGANRITVSEWMAEWYDTYEKRKVKPYTASAYRGIIKNHIKPAIGHIRLQQLRNVDIQRFYNALLDGGLSAKTIKNIDAVLSKGLNDAIKQGLIVQNPRNINIELPKQQRREITPLTEAEIPLFLKAIDTDEHRNAYALSLFCGLREGECLGLSWDSVDLAKKQITISRQLQRSKETGEYFIAESTKSSKERTIQLPDMAFAYLKAERIRQEERRLAAGSYWSNPANLVFTNELGEHIKIPTYYNHFKKIAGSIGRPDLRIHDLRRSAATVALAAGADIKSVQQLLGHSSATTTLNIYSHVTEKMASETAARIDGFYGDLINSK